MKKLIFVFFLIAFIGTVSAHTGLEENDGSVESYIDISLTYVLAALTFTVFMIVVAIYSKDKSEISKKVFFWSISIVVIGATAYSAGSTIYLNTISDTKGPVHWHADFEIWNCGEKVDMINPTGFSNRVGSPVLHEHGEDRIHVEGVLVDFADASLHSFFEVIGGELTQEKIRVPTNEGFFDASNGQLCDGKEGKLQVFIYKIKNPDDRKDWIFEQVKLEDIEEYVPSAHSNVPPGDCILVEFDEEKEKSEHACETYEVAMQRGELTEDGS